jgi:ACS family hexuronate transporter-like MFS transporter
MAIPPISATSFTLQREPRVVGRADSNLRWWICLLLFFATSINYLDRQILSLLKPVLEQDLHWSNEDYGVINASFQAAYSVGLLFFGWYIDRVGVKIGYATSIVFWSVAAASHALVSTVTGFLGARIFLGLSEAGNFPAAIKTVAQWFPKSERAFATALFNSGANVGAIMAPAIVPWLLFHYSWHAPFIVAGGAGMIWVAIWWFYYAAPENHRGLSGRESAWIHQGQDVSESEKGPALSWRALMGYRQTWSFAVAKALTDPVWYFLLIWLPDYFKKARGLDLKNSWPHLVTIYAVVTVLSLAGGWMTGYLNRRGWSITLARKTGLFCFALCALPVLAVSQAGDWEAVFLLGLTGAAHQAWSANLYTTVSDMFPNRSVATVIGIGSMAGSITSIFFTLVCGEMLDQFGQAGAHHSYEILFGYCSCAYLIAFLLNHLLAPRFEPVRF